MIVWFTPPRAKNVIGSMRTVHELGDIVSVSVGKAKARGLRSQTRCFHSKTHNAEANKLRRLIKENVQRPSAPLTRGFQLSGSLSCRFARLTSNPCSASSGVNFTTMPSRQITILVFDTRARSMTFRQASSNASSALAINVFELFLLSSSTSLLSKCSTNATGRDDLLGLRSNQIARQVL